MNKQQRTVARNPNKLNLVRERTQMSNLDKVRKIIIEAGGKSHRRPYTEDDMQNLRDAIWDVVRKWARRRIFGYLPGYPNGYYDDDLAELDVKRMALYALCLSILDIEDVGETVEDMDAFVPEAVYELECLIACFRGLPRPKKTRRGPREARDDNHTAVAC
jgi:hypothetical protein